MSTYDVIVRLVLADGTIFEPGSTIGPKHLSVKDIRILKQRGAIRAIPEAPIPSGTAIKAEEVDHEA